ncbi:transmembrane protein, putative (macronuclear) [Tetrahymena thermophila SB210]|uniref:Transmembrane protein, putative n=1 Tax=Tetrahymena thermophila (strain SB210) TaxID=312017 RepID=Q22V35_TETTS|nr:transmembrane protein, putative [Tetrahymena thermophila SB210]EAR89113.3 transmembrane protein, putative [Tetrahymena thermophila SB210]|eukprot:XP_001009358.3 transmembrane protein, putative [Tetrahymena thermophila SB210]
MIFSQILPTKTTNILVNSFEQYITVVGVSNLFQVWDLQKIQKIYEPNFQNIYCDQRDANQTSVSSSINFVYASINSLDEVVGLSNNYIFAYSLKEQKPIMFKNQNIGFNWIQAYISQNSIILCSELSISIIDIKSSKFVYTIDSFTRQLSAYDVPNKIEVDPDFNRIIKIDRGGKIQYWSYFDNIMEKQIFVSGTNSTFIIDKQLNKLVQQNLYTTTGSSILFVFDYRQGILIDSIKNAFPESNLQYYYLYQDKTNGYLIGIIQTSQYMIYNFNSSYNHSLVFKGTFLPNSQTQGIALLLESQKQLFIYINGVLYLFNYFYSDGDYNKCIPFNGENINFNNFFFNFQTQILFNIQEQQILQYQYNVNSLDLIQTISYNSGQSQQIYHIEQLNIFLINKGSQVLTKNHITLQEQAIDFKQDIVKNLVFDEQKAILIILTSSFKLNVFDLKTTMLLNSLQIQPQLIEQIQIDTHQQIIIISYDNGDILLYNYNIFSIVSLFNNMQPNNMDYFIHNYNTMTYKSGSEVYTKRLINFGQIAQITPQNNVLDFHIHLQSGLTFILTNQEVFIYNHISNQYLPPFPNNINLSNAYIIRGIPSQDTILIGYLTSVSNNIVAYKLSNYNYINTMKHDLEKCNSVAELYYDDYSNRLFSACTGPGTVIVWDASNQFQLIEILYQIVSVFLVSDIAFYPEQNQIMIFGYSWWSALIDYKNLSKICTIEGIFGNFDYFNQYQIQWDHIGYIRLNDLNCKQISEVQAHKQWIFEVLIDSQSFILTSISKDLFVKTWNYTDGIQFMSQLEFQNPLFCGMLDKDNSLVFIGDFNGFVYILRYPNLQLLRKIQVAQGQISKIFLDVKYNLILLGSQSSGTIKYLNIIELLVPNVYTNSFQTEGILSTLQVNQSVIFHQELNIVQQWNYTSQQLSYGFFVNSQDPSYEVQSMMILLQGQKNIGVLLTRDQTIFFDLNSLNLVNVQSVKCMRNTQLTSYFICSQLNVITVIDLLDFKQIQQIQIDQNSSIIQLESINELNSFFVTTTLGEIISFQLNDKNHVQFDQQFNINLLQQAIINYSFTQLENIYIILMASFDGNIACIKFNSSFTILEQQIITLLGHKSHAHIIKIFQSKVFIKRISDFYIGLYNLEDFTLVEQISSPCLGYVYKLDLNLELDYIIQSCVCIYQINLLSNFKQLGMGRFFQNLNLADVYTTDKNQIILINKEYFVDVYQNSIFIYQIDQISQTIKIKGQFSLDIEDLGFVSNYEIFNTLDNVYIKLILYSSFQIGQLQLPIYGQQMCQETLYIDEIASTFNSIESVYYKILKYFPISEMDFLIQIESDIVLQRLPNFAFSSQSLITYQAQSNLTKQIQAYVNSDFFESFSGYRKIIMSNLTLLPQQYDRSNSIFNIQNIGYLGFYNINLGDSAVYSFEISQINQVYFNQIQMMSLNMQSSQLLNLFSFYDVNQIQINLTTIQNCTFNQIQLFNFYSSLGQGIYQLQLTNLIIDNSKFYFSSSININTIFYLQNFYSVQMSSILITNCQGSPTLIFRLFLIENLILNTIEYNKNQDISFMDHSNSQQQVQQNYYVNYQLIKDNILLKNIKVISNIYTNIILEPTIKIQCNYLTINDIIFENNVDNTKLKTIILLYIQQGIQISSQNIFYIRNIGFNALIQIYQSNLCQLFNLQLTQNQIQQGLIIMSSSVKLIDSKIQNNNSSGQYSIITVQQKSTFSIKNTYFSNNLAQQNGGSIYISQSTQIIQNSKFEQDSCSENGGSIYSTQSNLSIFSTVFFNCSSLNGGCIYVDSGSLNLTQVQSQVSKSTNKGGFLFMSQISTFTVQDSIFQNSTAYSDGGCFYITKSGDNKSIITNSSFQFNNAHGSGGAILLDTSNFSLYNSNFIKNRAGIGGAIRYLTIKPLFMLKNQQTKIITKDSCKTYFSNSCKQNKAIIFGDSIASYPQYASIFPSRDFDVDIQLYPNITFSNFRSGLSNFDLSIQFLDEFKNPVNQADFQNQTLTGYLSENLIQEIRQYNCRVYITENIESFQKQTIKIEGATSIDYTFQSQNLAGCLMNNFKIAGIPSQSALVYLQLQGMKQIGVNTTFQDVNQIQIEIYFRSCTRGEYYNPTCDGCLIQECAQCQNGTYSLIIPKSNSQKQCQPCDLSVAVSCQLDQIVLKQNYWRSNKFSDYIYQCDKNIQSCNGDEQNNYCAKGYTGGLCSACDNYGKVWGNRFGAVLSIYDKGVVCTECSEIQANYFKQALTFIGVLVYLVILMIDSQNSNCKLCQIHTLKQLNIINLGVSSFTLQSSTIAKIFINQFQVFASLQQNIGITFPTLFSNLISFPNFSSQPIYIFIYSLDCSLSSINTQIPIQYLRFIYLSMVLPLIMLLALMFLIKGIIFILSLFNSNQYFNNQMYNTKNMAISSLIVFMYLVIQNIYQAALQIIFCQELDNKYYMKSQMDQICYTKEHNKYLFFLICPILLIIVITYPLILFYLIYHNKQYMFIRHRSVIIRRYGYIISGLKQNRWWWEFIRIYQKFIIIFLATFFNSQSLIQIQSILFLQSVYLALLIYFKPYENNKINKLELKSVTLMILIFWIAVFDNQTEESNIKQVSSVLLVALFIMLFGSLIASFLNILLRRSISIIAKSKLLNYIFMKFKKCLSTKNEYKVRQYLKKQNYSLYILIFKPNHQSLQVFKNWKRLRQLLQSMNSTKKQYVDKVSTLNNISSIHRNSFSFKTEQNLLVQRFNLLSNQKLLKKTKTVSFRLKQFEQSNIKLSFKNE